MSETSAQGWAVITGASSGLGAIFAERFAERNMPLVLAGRDEARLEQVRRRAHGRAPGLEVEVVTGDLGTREGVDDLITAIGNRDVGVLVNNAGFGTHGRVAETDAQRDHELVAVNIDALVRLTHALMPGMLARKRGGILNVASAIAFQPAPYQATYGASKAFVLSFSQALGAEVKGSGVTVTALCPGPTRTGFVDALGADVSNVAVYKLMSDPDPVVEAGLRAFDRGQAVVVPGLRTRVLATISKSLPASISTAVSARMLRPAKAVAS